ncbi:hypothetical protein [Pleomorphovibrio marinus]|uniref:hypothetical protein n=1 Tax=Pleomorphovibrio marinus TaxID=2164132 RepID=UPI001E3DE0A5|nr:hypothetical protein [Pleomorphovibrio marinus]
MKRRKFIRQSLGMGLGLATSPMWIPHQGVPVPKKITDGASAYWFGYYDKFQVDPSGRYALGCKVGFEGRSPQAKDTLEIGLIDLERENKWTKLGNSSAWGWQQSCMLQWIPGSNTEVIWNDREGSDHISRIHNVKTGEERTLPKPIYALAPNGKFAIGTAFNRIQNLRPGYGYVGIPDPFKATKAPEEIGLYKMDLQSGDHQQLLSIADMAEMDHLGEDVSDNWHWFNHLLVSPDSKRLLFLHRWRPELLEPQVMARTGFVTRMITVDADGRNRYVADPSGNSSHFVWRDPKHIFVWTKPLGKETGFWLLEDQSENMHIIGKETMTGNGHNTYVPNTNKEWVLNDTYPNKDRKITLYLYHIPTKKQVILGKFYSPESYFGEWRCDLHPRCDQTGQRVFFDSTHEGSRQMYYIDIHGIVGT